MKTINKSSYEIEYYIIRSVPLNYTLSAMVFFVPWVICESLMLSTAIVRLERKKKETVVKK